MYQRPFKKSYPFICQLYLSINWGGGEVLPFDSIVISGNSAQGNNLLGGWRFMHNSVKNWKQLTYSIIEDWFNKLWFTYMTVDYAIISNDVYKKYFMTWDTKLYKQLNCKYVFKCIKKRLEENLHSCPLLWAGLGCWASSWRLIPVWSTCIYLCMEVSAHWHTGACLCLWSCKAKSSFVHMGGKVYARGCPEYMHVCLYTSPVFKQIN